MDKQHAFLVKNPPCIPSVSRKIRTCSPASGRLFLAGERGRGQRLTTFVPWKENALVRTAPVVYTCEEMYTGGMAGRKRERRQTRTI